MTEFTTGGVFQALREPLVLIESPERRQQIEQYIEAARVPLERAVFDLLSSFAEAVDDAVSAHYRVTLAYRPGVLTLEVRPQEPAGVGGETWILDEGEVEKLTLRLPSELKDLATEAAARMGLSLNAWFIRMLARALQSAGAPPSEGTSERTGRRRRPGSRLTGWVGPTT
jgi:hypothetical protein